MSDHVVGLVESAAMKLSELVEGVSGATVRGDPGTEIRGLAYHTRDVADGTLFFASPDSRSTVTGSPPRPSRPAPRRWCASATRE